MSHPELAIPRASGVNGIATDGNTDTSTRSPPEQAVSNISTEGIEAIVNVDATADVRPYPLQSATGESTGQSGLPAPVADIDESTGRKIYSGSLTTSERGWRNRSKWLEEKGYMLRPRYRPDWKPSWEGTTKIWYECEDGLAILNSDLIDAVRISDQKMVMLKQVSLSLHPYETEIAQFFSSQPLASDPRNHCVPVYETLQDPTDNDCLILVMPFLRLYNDPPFGTVGEAVEGFRQIFEGLLFMHEHHVAHRDCMVRNIMMDPNPIFPNLYHPRSINRNRDFSGRPKQFTRTERPTRYYLIDFGLSRKYAADDLSPRELPIIGGDKSVPEHLGDKYNEPCNPFLTDVYCVGNLIREYHFKRYSGLEFMKALVSDMTQTEPERRPNMSTVVDRFEQLRVQLSSRDLRRRLVSRREDSISRFFSDIKHAIVSVGYMVRRLSPIPEPRNLSR